MPNIRYKNVLKLGFNVKNKYTMMSPLSYRVVGIVGSISSNIRPFSSSTSLSSVMSITDVEDIVSNSMSKAFPTYTGDLAPKVSPSTNTKFGDYQCNAAMALTKKLGVPPREIAKEIVDGFGEDVKGKFEVREGQEEHKKRKPGVSATAAYRPPLLLTHKCHYSRARFARAPPSRIPRSQVQGS